MRAYSQIKKPTGQAKSAESTTSGGAFSSRSRLVPSILHLHRQIRNQVTPFWPETNSEKLERDSAITELTHPEADFSQIPLHASAPTEVRPKLTVSTPGDPYEREADRVADQVMHMPARQLQRADDGDEECAKCENEQSGHARGEPAQGPTTGMEEGKVSPLVRGAARSHGQSLDPTIRAFFEQRFGRDFGRVRIHTDTKANEGARSINARAYTMGEDIVFGEGRYTPGTDAGRWLIAHELAHVVQQDGGDRGSQPPRSMAWGLADQNHLHISPFRGTAGTLQRQVEAPDEPDGLGTEPGSTVEEQPSLSILVDTVEHLAARVRSVTRDQTPPPLAGRVTEVGATRCNPDTGEPEWSIDRSRIPRCMWPCAERHEQTHVEFMRMPCQRVWIGFQRVHFWIRITRQYLQQGNQADVERAFREAQSATEEARRTVEWYEMFMRRTCRYDEATAYLAGIQVCDTDETRRRCTETGELAEYNRQLAGWRTLMRNPPNCPTLRPRRRTP